AGLGDRRGRRAQPLRLLRQHRARRARHAGRRVLRRLLRLLPVRERARAARPEAQGMSGRSERRDSGYVLGLTIHVVLLVAVLGMVVFLASRHRIRVDLTADGFYSLTGSTKRVLDRV